MRLSATLSNTVFKIEKILVSILVPIMLLTMVLDIIFRYFFKSPLMWGQELTLYTFVWSSFLGASMSVKVKEAVAVSLFVDRMKGKLRNLSIYVGLLISTIFVAFLLILAIRWITNPTILLQKTVTTQLPMIYMYLCIPISLLFMSIHFIHSFIEAIYTSKEGEVIE